ncbi:hypothetical protein NKR19_g3617 [Coniochaeta hoffmannii]|uniref:Uncharacterized protein n=1 Tax=Coniochaeta hoffmannii TaxID=91930 RepID=A0AA38RWR8_9PEZI|nr:hypothetical protein NKR19_g3617 [Coniochaeta hoffmannii]
MASTPSISWETACATSRAVAARNAAAVPLPTARPVTGVGRRAPQGNLVDQNPAACPTTYVVQPGQSAGSTSTRYQRTVTQTVRLPCGGCPLVLSTALAGYGPAGRFTTTVTSPVASTTTYVCQ